MSTHSTIQASREALGLSSPELADLLRVERSTVWRWEKGITPVPHAVGLLLALLCDHPEALDKLMMEQDATLIMEQANG